MIRTPKRDHTCIDCRVEFKALQAKQKRCKPCQEKFRSTGRYIDEVKNKVKEFIRGDL